MKEEIKEINGLTSNDDLLKLIEIGDATEILSERNLLEGFNELMKYELITITDGTVCLTELGKEAKREGVSTVIRRLQAEPVRKTRQPQKKFLTARNVYTLICFILMALTILLMRTL